ncbi:hypothetical protein [Streptomyces sp. NPDC005805]|uniref:hypothetical protein n=1 Tax=Streptomyces sp. NPDC005805 TaxID=3157068 RepID=UPI0033EDE801
MRSAVPSAESTPATDRALAAFLRARVAEASTSGCSAERKALAGVRAVLDEFEDKHLSAHESPIDDYVVGQIDALRWALQCVAAAAFSHHPALPGVLRPRPADAA